MTAGPARRCSRHGLGICSPRCGGPAVRRHHPVTMDWCGPGWHALQPVYFETATFPDRHLIGLGEWTRSTNLVPGPSPRVSSRDAARGLFDPSIADDSRSRGLSMPPKPSRIAIDLP